MNPRRLQRRVRGELALLRRHEVIDTDTYDRLLALYPAPEWDHALLGRWFLVFGAVSAAGGLAVLVPQWLGWTLETLALGLTLTIALCALASLKLRRSALQLTRRSVELLGGLLLIGLTFTLGKILSSGSGNWPALLLIDLALLVPLAYLLRNALLLALSAVVFFTWFGGVTGYESDWGLYWFGMNYPVRFLFAGLFITGVAVLHRRFAAERRRSYEGFFKVWLSSGVFFTEMSLWLVSLFGNYGEISGGGSGGGSGEIFFFNALWATYNVALLRMGSRYGLRMLRGYAVTFLVIHGYTLYFWKVAVYLSAVFATFLAGGLTLWLVVRLEKARRAAGVEPGEEAVA